MPRCSAWTRSDVQGHAGRNDGRDPRARSRSWGRPAFGAEVVSALGSDYRPATTRRSARRSAPAAARSGPVGVGLEIVADDTLREGQFVAGANRDGWHLLGVQAARDYEPRFADIREAREGDRCPVCGGALRFQIAIEVGHIFKFNDRYSTPLGATFLDEDGTEKPLIGGSYGVGPARVMAAAVEQSHDENGIVWPASIAPYDIHVLALHGGAPEVLAEAEKVASTLAGAGFEVLLTTATSVRARSLRMPIWWDPRCG